MSIEKKVSTFDITKVVIKNWSDSLQNTIFSFFSRYLEHYSVDKETFLRGTFNDEDFSGNLSGAAFLDGQIIGIIFGVRRDALIAGKIVVIKILLVHPDYRRKSIGSKLLTFFIESAKKILSKRSTIRFGDSVPRYWTPGVDIRHSSLMYFLEKFKFKAKGIRQNLTVPLDRFQEAPPYEKDGYKFLRVGEGDFDATYKFVKNEFGLGAWPQEMKMSLENAPPTTFIVKDSNGHIVGFATHSGHFPGSFGPTGIKKNLRGKGIGSILLRWCMYDLAQRGFDFATILWVSHKTGKFYSKSAGAYIHPIFIPMTKKI